MNKKIYAEIVKAIESTNTNIFSFIINDNGNYYTYGDIDKLNNAFSLTKLITALAIFKLIENGDITLDTKIAPFFDDKIIFGDNQSNKFFSLMKIRDLLTLSFGQDRMLLNEEHVTKYPNISYFELLTIEPLKYSPGKHFCYTNVCNYLLAYIVNKITDYRQLVVDKIFTPLGIKNFSFGRDKDGNYKGATGMMISTASLNKLGELIHNDGFYNGVQVLKADLVRSIKTIQVDLTKQMSVDMNRVLPKIGYGFNQWISTSGRHFIDGKDGQYIIVLPKHNIIISIMSDEKDMSKVRECFKIIVDKDN